jgi:hypothetical protein
VVMNHFSPKTFPLVMNHPHPVTRRFPFSVFIW